MEDDSKDGRDRKDGEDRAPSTLSGKNSVESVRQQADELDRPERHSDKPERADVHLSHSSPRTTESDVLQNFWKVHH